MRNEIPMVGIRFHGTPVRPNLCVRLRVQVGYDKDKEGDAKWFPEVEVEYEHQYSTKDIYTGKPVEVRVGWLPKIIEAIKDHYAKSTPMMEIGCYPHNKKVGDKVYYHNPYVGMVEIGVFTRQESYSDETYFVVRSDNVEMNKPIAECLAIAIPAGGGGVQGSSYKARGEIEEGYSYQKNPNDYRSEYVNVPYAGYVFYHQCSFGIGD